MQGIADVRLLVSPSQSGSSQIHPDSAIQIATRQWLVGVETGHSLNPPKAIKKEPSGELDRQNCNFLIVG
jgi:hypothetical protein